MSNEVLLEVNGIVATISLNRPARGNSLTPQMGAELISILTRLENDAVVRIVVLTGKGNYFCTGMDLAGSNPSQMGKLASSSTDGSQKNTGAPSPGEIFEKIQTCKKPTIAVLQGPVLAGGNGLAFACDFRVALKSCYFQLTEVKRGIVPAIISAYITPKLGVAKTTEFMLTGEKVTADEMQRLGVVRSVANSEAELGEQVKQLIGVLESSAPQAMAEVKRLVHYVYHHTFEENKKEVVAAFSRTVQSDEAKYGVACFLQKQQPNWSEFLKSKL